MKYNILIVLAVICGLFVSCAKWGSHENRQLMQQAQLLVEQMPDSALTLLDAMNTFVFSKAEKAEYNLMQIQAKRNAGMDISSDTEIFDVREYFIKKKDPQKAALSCYFAALVAAYQNNTTQALDYFQEAIDFAKKTDNKELQCRILFNMGYLNYDSGWYDDAIALYKQTLEIIQMLDNNYYLEVNTLNAIANTLMMHHQTDSAQYFYQQALDKAHLQNDAALKVMVYSNMGVAYRELNQLDKATFYSRQALQWAENDSEKIYIYLNLAEIYHELINADSARYYIQLAETLLNKTDNNLSTVTLANLAYRIEKTAGNCEKALEHFELHTKRYIEILEDSDRKLLLEMQRKYDHTSKENEMNRQRNRAWKIAGFALAILLMLAMYFIYLLRSNMKHREALAKEIIKNTENQLALEQAEHENMKKTLELEQALQQAQTLQELYHQKDNEHKTKFLKKIEILKEVALLFPLLDEDKLKEKKEQQKLVQNTREIVKKLDLQNFTDIANDLFHGFTCKLKQMYSELDEREISICCLLLFDFNNRELDLFINRRLYGSMNTIQTWKTAIRRKMGIDLHGDIKSHLIEKIVKKNNSETISL